MCVWGGGGVFEAAILPGVVVCSSLASTCYHGASARELVKQSRLNRSKHSGSMSLQELDPVMRRENPAPSSDVHRPRLVVAFSTTTKLGKVEPNCPDQGQGERGREHSHQIPTYVLARHRYEHLQMFVLTCGADVNTRHHNQCHQIPTYVLARHRYEHLQMFVLTCGADVNTRLHHPTNVSIWLQNHHPTNVSI